MSHITLTPEQERVILHPLGSHARVLAVAGSGKTTTLAHRVKHLVTEQNIPPRSIRVLMFNRLARVQFQEALEGIGIPRTHQPPVDTFHSFSYGLIRSQMDAGLLPSSTEFWLNDAGERTWLFVNIAIGNLERRKTVPPGMVDPEEAVEAIALWKGSLIPPERAGHRGNAYLPLVYAEYEQLRLRRRALTFDDFVPLAVHVLEGEPATAQRWCNRANHIIIDEYQDVNYGQQRLIELLAGQRADVMVVGDDDQTIYEWRGARPNYIIREFQTVFADKPHADYTLSRSFRFGPVIAQAACNVITFNTARVQKPLLAHVVGKEGQIQIVEHRRAADVDRELAEKIVTLVKQDGVAPDQIRVLVRTFAQLAGLEAEFLARSVPYRVVGKAPFFARKENVTLLDYIRLALHFDDPATQQAEGWLLSIANIPTRYLPHKALSQVMRSARYHQASPRQALAQLIDDPASSINRSQQEAVIELTALLDGIQQRAGLPGADSIADSKCPHAPGLRAGEVLSWLVDTLHYLDHFTKYYGDGWDAFDRQRAVRNFIDYSAGTGLAVHEFLSHIESLDTRQGAPDDQQIVLTTVFREKGREYDYIFIPQCEEGYMPCLRESGQLGYDTAGLVTEPELSAGIEAERRLFYVALTRARLAVFIGTCNAKESSPSRQRSRFLDEIQLQPSVSVMEALQRVASGVNGGGVDLLAVVKRYGNIRQILSNLVAGYLKDLGCGKLAQEVVRIASTQPEKPFAYSQSYSRPELRGTVRPQAPLVLCRAWETVAY